VSDILVFSLVMTGTVFVASCSQILLKKAAAKKHDTVLSEYLNWRVGVAYGIFFVSVLVNMYVLRHIPLSLAPVIETTGYIFVAVLSFIFIGERVSKLQLAGMVLIVFGIIIFSIRV